MCDKRGGGSGVCINDGLIDIDGYSVIDWHTRVSGVGKCRQAKVNGKVLVVGGFNRDDAKSRRRRWGREEKLRWRQYDEGPASKRGTSRRYSCGRETSFGTESNLR